MKMVRLPIFEGGKGTIKLDCVNLVKLFCFERLVNCVTKVDTVWYQGIWLGKDTEADESLVFGNGTVHKVRTVRRVVPSK